MSCAMIMSHMTLPLNLGVPGKRQLSYLQLLWFGATCTCLHFCCLKKVAAESIRSKNYYGSDCLGIRIPIMTRCKRSFEKKLVT